MGGGGTRVEYRAPEIPRDDSFQKYLEYQQTRDREISDRADREAKERKDQEDKRRTSALESLPNFRSGIEAQLRQGLISYSDATGQLRDYAAKYDIGPAEQDVTSLTNIYTQELLPGRRQTGVQAAYEELLGRAPTQEEQTKAMERFNQGYYSSVQDLKDSILKGSEYQDKFNQSYLDNYYDTMFGKQSVDAAGKKTGQRTLKFDSNLLPSYGGDLASRTKISLGQIGGTVTGTPAELQEQVQNIRDTRQYLFSAGLTNLQGDIDKEVQKLQNEGKKEVQKIAEQGGIYRQLVGSFSF